MNISRSSNKYVQLAESLEERILRGDYLLRPFPRDAELACEAKVDRRTAHKAVEILITKDLLNRKPNSSVTINKKNTFPKVALLLPSYPSPIYERWHRSIEVLAKSRGWSIRVIGYSHWNDHAIHAALNEFDGTFFCMDSFTTPLPDSLNKQLHHSKNRVVMLDVDLSSLGITSMWLTSPLMEVHCMLDYLSKLGHRHIAFLNTQQHDQVTRLRLQQWKLWTAMHTDDTELLDEPVKRYESTAERAYEVMNRKLKTGTLKSTAILCSTASSAIGVKRALYDHGLNVGNDLSLCSLDGGAGEARLLTPSLTCIISPDPAPYLDVCLDWMQNKKEWIGPLLLQPPTINIFEGESTAPFQ